MNEEKSPLMSHGGYNKLRAYKVAEAVYDATGRGGDRFVDKRSRTHDQRVQAARSGTRNISEGSGAVAPSNYEARTQAGVAVTEDAPSCSLFGGDMRKRTADKDPNAGLEFWGCIAYPECRGIVNIKAADPSDRSDSSDPKGG